MTHTNAIWSTTLRGVALGDAWGNPNEFRRISDLTRDDRRGPELPSSLEVTDDTQMTLYLAQALDATAGADTATVQAAIIANYIAYRNDPDFGSRAPGITVTGSIDRLERGLAWQDATDDHSDGCGTVMRVSPAAFVAGTDWVGIAAFSAAVTHGTANGIASAILNAALLRKAIAEGANLAGSMTHLALTLCWEAKENGLLDTGDWLDGLDVDLAQGFATLAEGLVCTRDALMGGYADNPWRADPCLYGGEGWRAHECLTTALLAVDSFPDNPWEALRRAVTTNGDSDSIGAVAGGLLGALHGEFWPDGALDGIEPRYLAEIAQADTYLFTPQPKGVSA
jgi:ADP-ribosylglycohydrolase